MCRFTCFLAGFIAMLSTDATRTQLRAEDKPTAKAKPRKPAFPAGKWVSLIDANSLKGWKSTKFGGEGNVSVKKGLLTLGFGSDLTGVTSTRKDLPNTNYEVKCEAQRVNGSDFFCGLTFPIQTKNTKTKKLQTSYASLIVGGWGGGVCGISSLDALDASENETTTYQEFEKKKWYAVRLRITGQRIEAWLGKKKIVDQEIKGKTINVRTEVELSRPFGLSSYQTTAAIRNLQLRRIPEKEVKALYEKWAKE